MPKIIFPLFLQNGSIFIIRFISKKTTILGQEGKKKHFADQAKVDVAHGSNVSRLQEVSGFLALISQMSIIKNNVCIILIKIRFGSERALFTFYLLPS